MFQQVFFNLLGNSIKYCFRDTDSFNVQIRTGRDAHNYQIFFEDWGIGIPEGYENVIFEQYVRAPGAEEYDASGDGLGLWVVRGIVEAHGGHIKATHLHQPTQITIFLPTELASPDFRMDNEQKGAWK
jgi:K+-sensing histidine kinase KdpD